MLIPVKAAKGFKPTIATAQSHTYCIVKTKEEALEELNSTEPDGTEILKLIVLGESDVIAYGECIVGFGNTRYVLPNVVRGIDVYVKISRVLGLPTSKISKLIWEFVITFVYGAGKSSSYASVSKLIKFIESCS